MIDLKELRRQAEAATPGPWNHTHIYAGEEVFTGEQIDYNKYIGVNAVWTGTEYDARFIEASNPDTVLKLLEIAERCAQLEAWAERAKKDLEQLFTRSSLRYPGEEPSIEEREAWVAETVAAYPKGRNTDEKP